MYDVTALGELLIDFTPYNSSQPGKVVFERNPGGRNSCYKNKYKCNKMYKNTLYL